MGSFFDTRLPNHAVIYCLWNEYAVRENHEWDSKSPLSENDSMCGIQSTYEFVEDAFMLWKMFVFHSLVETEMGDLPLRAVIFNMSNLKTVENLLFDFLVWVS